MTIARDDRPRLTNRTLVLATEQLPQSPQETLRQMLPADAAPAADTDVLSLPGGRWVARVNRPPDQLRLAEPFFTSAPDRKILVEAEQYAYGEPRGRPTLNLFDSAEITPSLRMIGIDKTTLTGRGAVVAVLDGGLDTQHPDFSNRSVGIVLQSFVSQPATNDTSGHGTHCAGVIGGPLRSSGGPRYGVAPNATLLIAKVTESINGDVRSDDFTKIRGLLWAAGKGAHVASISLGTLPATDCETFSPILEFIAVLLRDLFGTIIVAACGNGSNRLPPNVQLAPIFHHADCPTIMAVAAVGMDSKVARNSCGSICGQRNPSLAAPGDGIRSAFPTTISAATPFASFEGTSSATPHVAGVAALWVERTRGRVRGKALQNCVMSKLKSLSDGADAVGNGLVLAPTATDPF